jgi:hypothetical protein
MSHATDNNSPEMVPFGTCQVCGRAIRVLKNGMIARHGWRAHPLFRLHTSSCYGSQNQPLQVSRELLIDHVARLSEFNDFGPETITPKGLLRLISEKMNVIKNWAPKELTLAPRIHEAPEAPTAEKAPEAPAAEKAPKTPAAEKDDFVRPSSREVEAMIEADSYTLGDEAEAPTAELKTLKSGAVRLKAAKKLAVGDLVLVPARAVMCYSEASKPAALVPTRVLRVSRSGAGLDFIYLGHALINGEIDQTASEELQPYKGIFQP